MPAFREEAVPLADDVPRVRLERKPRSIQNGSNVYNVSLNQDFLDLLGALQQGHQTMHSVALRPVEIRRPAYIIQPAEVLDE